MPPWSNVHVALLAAGDFILTAIFYVLYRRRRHLFDAVKSATLIASTTDRQKLAKLLFGDVDGEKLSGPTYVVIDGEIEPCQSSRKGEQPQAMTSMYRPESPMRGVYRIVTSEERYLRRAAGNWYEVVNTVGEDVGHVPACVVVSLTGSSESSTKQDGQIGQIGGGGSSSLLSPSAWGSVVVTGSKYIWNWSKPAVMFVPRLIYGGSTSEKNGKNATVQGPSVPKDRLIFNLPPLNLADESILQESCLTLIHSDFKEKNHNIAESFSQVLFGNIFLGTINRERLLLSGSRIFAFANLEPVKAAATSHSSTGSYRLTISSHGGDEVPFIITCLTPEQLASRLKTPVIIYGILSLVGFGCLVALGAKWWYDRHQERQVAARARTLRHEALNRRNQKMQAAGEQPDNNPSFDVDSTCVICLEARRDVALLPCGHVCMCSNCFHRLPTPTCPMCRQIVTGTTPLFFS